MYVSDYLIIEQMDGWWIMLDGAGLGPFPSKTIARQRAGTLTLSRRHPRGDHATPGKSAFTPVSHMDQVQA